MTSTPIDLFAATVLLHPGGEVESMPRTFDPDQESPQVMAFHVETEADVHPGLWEIHPHGQELVCCLTGGIRLCLRAERPGEQETEIKLTPGTAAVVPRGRWHRIELDAPGDIMAVTVARGTRHEERTGS